MPFKSSEIRWFSADRKVLSDLFNSLPKIGLGKTEPTRTDYYLQAGLSDTGIKIREGNHEIKIKTSPDELRHYGKIEHWIKWSSSEKENILNTVSIDRLSNWIAIEKRRFKKVYIIANGKPVVSESDEFVEEGCGIEFTELLLPQLGKTFYTFGMEAFSTNNCERNNLTSTLNHLPINWFELENHLSCGYPEWLKQLT